ncbi:hypothetical protein ACFLWS_03150 [Chloroflexota bacterium]
MKSVSKKAAFPPLGSLTVTAMLAEGWDKKLVNMNVGSLIDKDVEWADYVFVSGMAAQKKPVKELIARCKTLGVNIIVGAPLLSAGFEEFDGADHFAPGRS